MKKLEYGNKVAECRAGLARVARHSLFVILLGILCLLLPARGFGQSANRWLFIFNTSSAMRDRSKGVQAVTQDLLSSAMHGTMRDGDTIGLWTYNNKLRAEEAPLQTWSPDTSEEIVRNTVGFLSRYRYEKSAAFGDVLTNMLRVVKISGVVTVILISDGNDPIKGTPFDDQLAAAYKTNSLPQKKAHQPVVTVFRGYHGKIITNTVNLAPWPVEIPAMPPPEVAKVAPPKPAPPKPPVVPSIIMIGKKPEPVVTPPPASNPVAPDASIPAVQNTAAPKVEVSATTPQAISTPSVAPEEKPKSAATPVTAAVETPKPVDKLSASVSATNQPVVPSATPPVQPVVETAVTVSPPNLFNGRNIAIISVAFAVIVCGLLILGARRTRNASRASLITRSLDRERK